MFATVRCSALRLLLLLGYSVLAHSDRSYQLESSPHSGTEYFTTPDKQGPQTALLLPTDFTTHLDSSENKWSLNDTKLAPILQPLYAASSTHWTGHSETDSRFNRDYFDQVNALNHRQPLDSDESQPKPLISEPPVPEWQGRSQENVYYYSPSAYGKSSSSPNPNNSETPFSLRTLNNSWNSAPSVDKTNSKGIETNSAPNKSVQWSIPGPDLSADHHKPANRVDYPASYSSELNKLLLQRYYNRDLSSISALLNKQSSLEPTTKGDHTKTKQTVDPAVDIANDEEDDDGDEEEESPAEDSTKTLEGVQYLRPDLKTEYSKAHSPSGHLLSEYRSGEPLLRVHSSRVVRPYGSRSMPVRLQTAHSHSMPHYYMPHGATESGHHHLVSDKSSNWLGSGLAAGILIGAIPFGIMMASFMPTLLSTAMPIVNTATVAGKRRRRRAAPPIKDLFMDQAIDALALFLQRSVSEMLSPAAEPSKYNSKNDAHEYNVESDPQADVVKTVARYALAAVDEPKCIKELFCALVAGGRNAKTTPLQKSLYLITKWIPKDIERTFGLNVLLDAIRQNACLTTYKCPISVIGMRKRSFGRTPSTGRKAHKMT